MSEAEQNAYRRDQIGFIFQSFNLISNLTAVENVLVPFLPRGVTPEQPRSGPSTADGGRPGRPARPSPLSALRRRAAARGDRPGADQGPDPRPGRRADRRARLQDRRRDLQDPPAAPGERQTTLVVVTHDRRFITPDDLVLEIQDGQLKALTAESEPQDDLTEAEVRFHPRLAPRDAPRTRRPGRRPAGPARGPARGRPARRTAASPRSSPRAAGRGAWCRPRSAACAARPSGRSSPSRRRAARPAPAVPGSPAPPGSPPGTGPPRRSMMT